MFGVAVESSQLIWRCFKWEKENKLRSSWEGEGISALSIDVHSEINVSGHFPSLLTECHWASSIYKQNIS